ncbi:MAG: AraC family transcriptional regulator [Gammaproteobacteria bacterium]|nr:AraC family transcriptional regulator [Gammaproteobacteria bacterium]
MPKPSSKLSSGLSDSGFLVQMVYPALQKMGLDVERVVRECRISPRLLKDRTARFPHSAQLQFWRLLEDLSGDPQIGLHLAENLQVYRGQVLEYLFLSSANFGEGLRRAQNYQRLISDATQFELQEHESTSRLVLRFADDGEPGFRHRNECFARFLLRYFQAVTNGAFVAAQVDFNHSLAGDEAEYRRAFGCRVRFEQPVAALLFDTALLATPSSHAEPNLLRLHESLARKQLDRLTRQDLIGEVEKVIAQSLELGQPSLEAVAAQLGMHERVLRSRLANAGTNFNRVLADYRCSLAKRLLAATDESISDVVYLTGFSEPSTFYRAFKRWTGLTPIEYRQAKQAKDSN